MIIETHCHTGASFCADSTPEFIAKKYKELGYGGIVVTNHINAHEWESKYEGNTDEEKVDYYMRVFSKSKKAIEGEGLKCFFACEVCVKAEKHSEYILLGINEKFLKKYIPLFKFTQKQLFEICEKENVFMYKAHPFRDNELCGDPKYMHGAECFNGHFHHNNHNERAEKFCEENNLIKMSGTDYHHSVQPVTAGIEIPDYINDVYELRDSIRSGKYSLICDKEKYKKTYEEYHKK